MSGDLREVLRQFAVDYAATKGHRLARRGLEDVAVSKLLALFPREGEPVAWMCEIETSLGWATDLVTDDLGVVKQWERETHGIERGSARVVPLFATPQESAEAVEWVRHAMTKYHGMRHAIGKYMWARGETILGEQIEGLPPEESAEPCPVCGGTPHVSKKPCICGGTNRLTKAFKWYRDHAYDLEAEVERLRGSLEEWQLDFKAMEAEVERWKAECKPLLDYLTGSPELCESPVDYAKELYAEVERLRALLERAVETGEMLRFEYPVCGPAEVTCDACDVTVNHRHHVAFPHKDDCWVQLARAALNTETDG